MKVSKSNLLYLAAVGVGIASVLIPHYIRKKRTVFTTDDLDIDVDKQLKQELINEGRLAAEEPEENEPYIPESEVIVTEDALKANEKPPIDEVLKSLADSRTDKDRENYNRVSKQYHTKPENVIGDENTYMSVPSIRIISPNEYAAGCDAFDDLSILNFTCYSDGIVTDSNNDRVMNESYIRYFGNLDILEHFGEFLPNTVYVRNDDLACDIEIELDERNYFDSIEDY